MRVVLEKNQTKIVLNATSAARVKLVLELVVNVQCVLGASTVRVIWILVHVKIVPVVLAKKAKAKLLVCPAFLEHFKILQVKLRVKRALKI